MQQKEKQNSEGLEAFVELEDDKIEAPDDLSNCGKWSIN